MSGAKLPGMLGTLLAIRYRGVHVGGSGFCK